MELKWLEDLLSLSRTRSFSRTATERFCTQSALSRRIKALELWVGVPLVDRGAYPASLTPAGIVFRDTAEEVMQQLLAVRDEQHFTEPPPRYSEASLVKKLEELGIGRPSTYASILSTLRDRAYVRMDRNRFIPEDKGRIVTAFLTSFFKHYVEYDFTADLEEKLDEVSAGELSW